jgi:YgiT-type zinc finger domain-containing protein
MTTKTAGKICPLCGGTKKPGKATFTVETGEGVVVVRNVPAEICDLCGEEWIVAAAAKELETHVENARQKHLQVEVVPF